MAVADAAESVPEARELVAVEQGFNAGEEGAFLVPDMIVQRLTQPVQGARIAGDVALLQIADPAPDVSVLDKHPYDVGVISACSAREGGKQKLLLQAEVLAPLGAPELQCGLREGFCVGRAGAA